MAKAIPAAVIDAMLTQAEGTRIHICSAEPANYAGISVVELAAATIDGSYTKGAGDVSGRKNTLPGQDDLNISASGTATHVAISNGTDTLRLVTTCTSRALTEGDTVSTSSFAHEIRDPS